MIPPHEAILGGPGRLRCDPLAARISERQCLVNQVVVGVKAMRRMYPGRLAVCLDCPTGREVAARHPEGLEVERWDVYGIPKEFKREAGQVVVLPPPEPQKAPVMTNTSPTSRTESEQLLGVPLPPTPEPQASPEVVGGGVDGPEIPPNPPLAKGGRQLPKAEYYPLNATPAVRRSYGF